MFDAGALDPGGELRADLLCRQRRDLPAEERGDLLRLHVQHRLADQLLIEWATERGGGTGCQWRIPPASGSGGEISSLAPPIRPAVDPGPPPVAPNLADPTTRLRLTPAAIDGILKLAEIWRLTSAEACALLRDISERSWFRMKKGERAGGSLSQDTLTRMSALIGIFKGLRLLLSEPLSDEWIRLPNKGPLYAGRRPLDALIEGGIPKMLEVRRHIDALRGGL